MCFAPQRHALFRDLNFQKWSEPLVFYFQMCFAPQRRALFRHLNFQKWSEPLVFCTFWLGNVLRATTVCTFSTSQLPKVVRTPSVLYILTWKCASRHNGVHFFDIWTYKSGPNLVCFVHCTFWVGNVLGATTACTFSTSQLPKVVRHWGVLCIFTSKCASRHNGVQFFISRLARWLSTRRFSEPTFRLSGASNHWKNTVFRDFPIFSRICICFLLTLSLLWSSLFYSPLLSASAQLGFSSVHIVGSLTSKLPSIILLIYTKTPAISSPCWSATRQDLVPKTPSLRALLSNSLGRWLGVFGHAKRVNTIQNHENWVVGWLLGLPHWKMLIPE